MGINGKPTAQHPITWLDGQHIYLSPHLDDAVLSCGGTIYQQARRGETVAVITLFAASPPANMPLSPFAHDLHRRWQASAPASIDFSDLPAMRRAEDRRALAALSPAIRVIHHALPDCIYRRDPAAGQILYDSEGAIFGLPHPADPALADLRDAPPLPEGATLYVPLAVGGHVDHRIVRNTVEDWGLTPDRVRYYEDYPYVTSPGALEAALGDPSAWNSITTPLGEKALSAKIRAIAEYPSQISSFWASEQEMLAALKDQAQRSGGERLWVKAGIGR